MNLYRATRPSILFVIFIIWITNNLNEPNCFSNLLPLLFSLWIDGCFQKTWKKQLTAQSTLKCLTSFPRVNWTKIQNLTLTRPNPTTYTLTFHKTYWVTKKEKKELRNTKRIISVWPRPLTFPIWVGSTAQREITVSVLGSNVANLD